MTFNNYLAANGIQRQLTIGYSPHQNGVAERKNRTLLEGIRSVVTGTKIPKALWEDLAYSVNYIQNRCPTKALKLKTPEEVFTGIKPHFRHLHVIGCLAYCHIPDVKRQKLDPKTTATIFIGYDEHSKAYQCYHPPSRKILVNRDVRFDEQQFTIPLTETTEPLEDHSFLDRLLSHTKPMTQPICIPLHSTTVHPPQTPQSVLLPSRTQHSTHSHNTSLTIPQPSNLPTQSDPVTPTSNPTSIDPPSDSLESPLPESNLPEVPVVIPCRSERPRKQSIRLDGYELCLSTTDFDICTIRKPITTPNSSAQSLTSRAPDSDNITFKTAKQDPEWRKAMQDEMDSIWKNKTWTMEPLPPGHRAITCKWVSNSNLACRDNLRSKRPVL